MPRTGTRPLAVPAAWRSPVRDPPQANTAPLARPPCRGDRFPRSVQEPRPRSRHLHAGHHLANQQAPARLIPGLQSIPGFDVNLFLRHVISGSLALAFVIHTCRAHGATFPVTLTTAALDRSSSRWFAASACTAATEGHRANRTRLLHLLHSTAFRIWVFYIQPPSTFVAHHRTISSSARQRAAGCCFVPDCERVARRSPRVAPLGASGHYYDRRRGVSPACHQSGSSPSSRSHSSVRAARSQPPPVCPQNFQQLARRALVAVDQLVELERINLAAVESRKPVADVIE